MPRLFIGLEVPGDIAAELDLFKGGIPGARWIDRDSFHITLRFVGDVSGTLADELDHALTGLQFNTFELQLKGAGHFGGSKPRALYASVLSDFALDQLQMAHERTCQAIGLPPEGRKFTPHVTLARFRNSPLGSVNDFISRHGLYASRKFDVTRFALFSAKPSRGGGPYVRERTYDLERSM